MTNPNNNGTQIGRIAADAKIFANNDGSHNVKFNAYVQQNFRSRNGEWGSDRLPFESGYLKPGTDVTTVPFANAREGDLVAMSTHVEDATYTPAGANEPVYGIRLVVDDFWFQEAKSVRDGRAADKAAKRAQGQNVQTQPAAQPAPTAQPAAAQNTQPAAQAPAGQTVPAWAQEQTAPVAAQPVAVPAQAQPVTVPQQVAVPAQAQVAAGQTGGIDDNPPF